MRPSPLILDFGGILNYQFPIANFHQWVELA